MKAAELLKLGAELLKKMSQSELRIDDYRYIEAYNEFVELRVKDVKYSYAIYLISKKYGISESTLKRIIRRLGKEVIS